MDRLGKAVGKSGLLRCHTGCVHSDPWIGQPRQLCQILGLVPDQAKELIHLMNQPGARGAALAMFQRRQIGGRNL